MRMNRVMRVVDNVDGSSQNSEMIRRYMGETGIHDVRKQISLVVMDEACKQADICGIMMRR